MRLQIVPGSLSETLALPTGKVPLPVLDTLLPLVKARALMAGERLGVFEALREGPVSVAALADRLGLDADSLALCLRVLTAARGRARSTCPGRAGPSGYLRQRGGRFRLSPVAHRTLLRGGRLACDGFVRFAAVILSIGLLATAVPEVRAGWAARLSRLALLVVAAAGTIGAAVSALAPLAARLVGAGTSHEVVSRLRGLVLSAGAIALAQLGRREGLRDATWLAYSMFVLIAFEMVEALPSSRPGALALAIAGYGTALLLVARRRRRPAVRPDRGAKSEGGSLTSPNRTT